MDKQTFENVKAILTTHPVYANRTDYSLSILKAIWDKVEYYRIAVYSNSENGAFHGGFASFFCKVADITYCHCAFRSENGVCVCYFY